MTLTRTACRGDAGCTNPQTTTTTTPLFPHRPPHTTHTAPKANEDEEAQKGVYVHWIRNALGKLDLAYAHVCTALGKHRNRKNDPANASKHIFLTTPPPPPGGGGGGGGKEKRKLFKGKGEI